jgi:hypothetical protein
VPGKLSPGIARFRLPAAAPSINDALWVLEVPSALEALADFLRWPFSDPWDNGRPIDGYLSPSAREEVLALLAAHIQATREAGRMEVEGPLEGVFERWQFVYNGLFPAMR